MSRLTSPRFSSTGLWILGVNLTGFESAFGHKPPGLANDLFFCKSHLHAQSPFLWDWTPMSGATQIQGDVDANTKQLIDMAIEA